LYVCKELLNGLDEMKLHQAKALFFSQYLGQTVHSHLDAPNLTTVLTTACLFGDKEWFLLLRSVNQLTDEEKLQVGIKAFPMFVPFPENQHETLRKLALTVLDRGHLSWVTRQTLIGYGVLVPFIYIDETNNPIVLSIEEIISLNWAKLKQN
jgi:hypothetical protein